MLGGDGSLTSEKAFNFGFYTKVNIGDAVVNLKLSQSDTDPQRFNLNWDDVDLIVETFYNRVETVGAGVSAGGEAANFVKVDNNQDIAMGNGGNDTYVIGSNDDGVKLLVVRPLSMVIYQVKEACLTQKVTQLTLQI